MSYRSRGKSQSFENTAPRGQGPTKAVLYGLQGSGSREERPDR